MRRAAAALAALLAALACAAPRAAAASTGASAEAALHQARRHAARRRQRSDAACVRLVAPPRYALSVCACAVSLVPQIVRDPLALDDSFAALPERLKAHWAASAPHATLSDLLTGARAATAASVHSARVAAERSAEPSCRLPVCRLCALLRARAELSKPLEVRLSLEIRLVGFDGDGCVARFRKLRACALSLALFR
jgi:hypothetical protein